MRHSLGIFYVEERCGVKQGPAHAAACPRFVPGVWCAHFKPGLPNRAHESSLTVTCLMSPPRQSALLVGRSLAWSSLSSRVVYFKKNRASASRSKMSWRSGDGETVVLLD